jgi:hypothetical protein
MKNLFLVLITVFSLNGFAQDKNIDEIFDADTKLGVIKSTTHVVIGLVEVNWWFRYGHLTI